MDSAPAIIEKIFVAHASLIDEIKTVFDHEPGQIDRLDLPALTMFFLLPEATESETGAGFGPGEDYGWVWEIKLYVTLADWKSAQQEMRDLSQKVLDNFREHRLDYDGHEDPRVDIFARELRRRIPPTPDDDEAPSFLVGGWELRVTGSIAPPTE